MASLISEFRATEDAIKELQARLANMQKDGKLQEELEFEGKLRALMGEYGKSLRDVNALLDPQGNTAKRTQAKANEDRAPRRQRSVKQYKNPHNGEVIETKGGNHKTLKEWKSQWGSDTVESWVTILN